MDICSMCCSCRVVSMRAALAIRCCTVITPPSEAKDAFSAVSFRAEMEAPAAAKLSISTAGMRPQKELCTHQPFRRTQ